MYPSSDPRLQANSPLTERAHSKMSIAELKQVLAQQQATPVRRFDRVEDVLTFATNDKPDKTVKVTLDMCVFSVEEKAKFWSIMLVPKSPDNFQERKKLINNLDDDQKSKYLFCLALWKAKRPSSHDVRGEDYLPGNDYVFSNVNDIHVYYGIAQGSVHVRHVIKQETDDPRFVKSITVTSSLKTSARGTDTSPKMVGKSKASLDTKKESARRMKTHSSGDEMQAATNKAKAKASVNLNELCHTKASDSCNEMPPEKAKKTKAGDDINQMSPKKMKKTKASAGSEMSPKKAKTKIDCKETVPRKSTIKASMQKGGVSPKKAKEIPSKARLRKPVTGAVVKKRVSRAKTAVSKVMTTVRNPNTTTSKLKNKATVARIVVLGGDDGGEAVTNDGVNNQVDTIDVN